MKRITLPPLELEHVDACFFEEEGRLLTRAQVRARVGFPHISAGLTKCGDPRSQRLSCDLHAHTNVRHFRGEGIDLHETGGRGFWDVRTVLNQNPNPTTETCRSNVGWQTALRDGVDQMFQHTAKANVMTTEKLHWLHLGYSRLLSTALEGALSSLMEFHFTKQVPTLEQE